MRWIFICTILIPSWAAARVFHAGLHAVSFDYREDLPSPLRSRESGILPLLELGLSFEPDPGLFLRGTWLSTYRSGTFYEGSNLSTNENVSATDVNDMHHAELRLAKKLSDLSLSAGLAFDEWNRYLSYGSGYREIYRWWTLIAGASVPLDFAPGLSLEGAVLLMNGANLRVIFSETVTNGEDSTVSLGNRVGFRVGLPYEFVWRDNSWTLTPWVQATSFGESSFVDNSTPGLGGRLREPASQTRQFGLGLRWNQAF